MNGIGHNLLTYIFMEYPKLISSNEMIKKLAEGAMLQEKTKDAEYFCSVKNDGEEFEVYIKENKSIK